MSVAVPHSGRIVNAMTVDVEDYFQVSAFENRIPRGDWPRWPQRVEGNTERVLDLLGRHGIRATFFVLGWVAERFPALVRRIADSGHEVASHGVAHERLTTLNRTQFRESVTRSKHILEQLAGTEVRGYRAPSYSIGPTTLWAYEELQCAGYRYSSSIVPIRHDLYGMPAAPRFAFVARPTGLLEIPVTTVRLLGRNWPCGGGGYFRLLPYPLFRLGLRRVNLREQRPGVFYFHPWEIDPDQPRVPGVTFKNRVRHYLNLACTEARLDRLMRDFGFDRMDSVFVDPGHDCYPAVALRDSAFCAH
jgi:polysaccharide deacetylase family protein (PEP-CTERM system associated)